MKSDNIKAVCQKKLESLLPNITAEDKKEIVQSKIVSYPTLAKYLKGDITKVDKATRIITFFSERIQHRIDVLKQSNVA